MGCDGIWETKSNQELCTIVNEGFNNGKGLQAIVEGLLEVLIAPDTSSIDY